MGSLSISFAVSVIFYYTRYTFIFGPRPFPDDVRIFSFKMGGIFNAPNAYVTQTSRWSLRNLGMSCLQPVKKIHTVEDSIIPLWYLREGSRLKFNIKRKPIYLWVHVFPSLA